MDTVANDPRPPVTRDIIEGEINGLVLLSPATGKKNRRVLYLDSYGGRALWEKIKLGLVAPHHLRGCLELVRMGYEVALAEPVPDFWQFRKKPLPRDLILWRTVIPWLGRDGIIF